MNNQPSDSPSQRLPSLDGWRAVSITLVLGAHCRETAGFPPSWDSFFEWTLDGNLGVRMFFIISGFLITWLMMKEHDQTGRLSLPLFYVRRALRILPVYMAFLGTLALLQTFTPYHQSSTIWARNLTFTTNFEFGGGGGVWTSGHLWSLAVEEQFYILWPVTFVLCGLARRLRLSLLVLSLPVITAPLFRVVAYLGLAPAFLTPLFSAYSFFKYFDSLAIGCGCAILFVRKRDLLDACEQRWRRLIVPVSVLLVAIPHVITVSKSLGIFTVPLGSTVQNLGMAMLLMQSLMVPQLGVFRFLNRPFVCQIGVLSYSIYIWQQIFSTSPANFGLTQVWWMSFPLWLLPVFVVAIISYYGLEQPLFKLRSHFRTSH